MTERIIDNELRLIPYYRNDEASLPWYQDLDVCRQVDNREKPYDVELLHRMYDYLTAHGDCYYIEYKGVLVGDVSLREIRTKPMRQPVTKRKCRIRKPWRNPTRMKSSSIILPE